MESYVLLLRLPKEQEKTIKDVAWRKRTSVSAYIRELIEADLKKNGVKA